MLPTDSLSIDGQSIHNREEWPIMPVRTKMSIQWPSSCETDVHRRQFCALLRKQTEDMKRQLNAIYKSFKTTFLKRLNQEDVTFFDLFSEASILLELKDADKIEEAEDTKKLLNQMQMLISKQSFVNCHILLKIIASCGTEEDRANVEKFEEAYKEYAKNRVLDYGTDFSEKLENHQTAVFIIDANEKDFTLSNAEDFTIYLSETLNLPYQKIKLYKVISGSIIIHVQIPIEYMMSLRVSPLHGSRITSFQQKRICSYSFEDHKVNVKHWNVLNSVNIEGSTIFHHENNKIYSVHVEGEEYMGLEYMEEYSASEDIGYIKYLESLVGKNHPSFPAIKGIYYPKKCLGEKRQYPVVITEKLSTLGDIAQNEVSEVNQVSMLLDLAKCKQSFTDNTWQVKVQTDTVFVRRNNATDIEVKFCPLYGYSFIRRMSTTTIPRAISLPLDELQWMKDLVKAIHFRGKITDKDELPEKHLLKKVFDQKWLSKDERFRPPDFKILSDELQDLLGKFSKVQLNILLGITIIFSHL